MPSIPMYTCYSHSCIIAVKTMFFLIVEKTHTYMDEEADDKVCLSVDWTTAPTSATFIRSNYIKSPDRYSLAGCNERPASQPALKSPHDTNLVLKPRLIRFVSLSCLSNLCVMLKYSHVSLSLENVDSLAELVYLLRHVLSTRDGKKDAWMGLAGWLGWV